VKSVAQSFWGPVHAPKKSENGVSIIYFPSTLAVEIWKRNSHRSLWDLFSRETRSGKSHDYRDVIIFKTAPFLKCFSPTLKQKPPFSDSSGLKSVFEKLSFRYGVVWTAGLIEIYHRIAAFSSLSGEVWISVKRMIQRTLNIWLRNASCMLHSIKSYMHYNKILGHGKFIS